MKRSEKIMVAIPQKYIPKGEFGRWGISYGPLIIAQTLKEEGFPVSFYDFGIAKNEESGITDKEIKISGTPDNKIEEIILKEDPDVLAISANFTYLWGNVEHLIKLSKKVKPNIKIVIGGNHTDAYKEILELPISKHIDAIVRGTDPRTLVDLLKTGELSKANEIIVTRKNRMDKSKLGPYDYDLIDFSKYGYLNHATIPVEGKHMHYLFSLGCNNACKYCQVSFMHGMQTAFPEEKIKQDLKELKDRGIEDIIIYDDNFFRLPDKIIKKDLEIASEYFSSIHLDGGIENSILTDGKIGLLASSNVKAVYLAVETIDISKMRKLENAFKDSKQYLNHLKKQIKMLKDAGIKVYTNSMCAFPGYTKKDLKKEMEFQRWLKDNGVDWVTFATLKLFPGTPDYFMYYDKIPENRKWQNNPGNYILCGGPALFDGKDISGKDAGKMLREAYDEINGPGLPMNPNPYWGLRGDR